jgi:hypothetical protein
MVVESRRENFSVSEYLVRGEEQWYAATDPFRRTENTNNPPPVVSLFKHNDAGNDNNTAEDFLTEAELANLVAHRVGHLNSQMRNQNEHFSLKHDLVHHLWHRRQTRRPRNIPNNNENHHDEE